MATIGKWWGRKEKTLPTVGWIPSGYAIAGVPAYNQEDGRFYVVLIPTSAPAPGAHNVYVRSLYSSTNIATISDYSVRNYTGFCSNMAPFFYNGFIYFTKTKTNLEYWLVKVNVVTGAETEVKLIVASSIYFSNKIFSGSFVFDGVSVVYFITDYIYSFPSPYYSFNLTINKYDISSDTLTLLKTINLVNNEFTVFGIGVDSSKIYAAFQENGGAYTLATMALDGSSYTTYATQIKMLGFRGNGLNTTKHIFVQGGADYTFTKEPLLVFILQDGTAAQLKFAGFFSDGTYVYYVEADGSSGSIVEKYTSASLGAVANFLPRGIFPFRSDQKLEAAIGFMVGGYANWFEAATRMKEVF